MHGFARVGGCLVDDYDCCDVEDDDNGVLDGISSWEWLGGTCSKDVQRTRHRDG